MNNADKWSRWSSIAEIISSIAVLVTIVFLVVETRQNNELMAQNNTALLSNGRQAMLQTELEYLYSAMDYPNLIDAGPIERYLIPGISAEDDVRRSLRAAILIRMRETSWLQYKSGIIDESAWNSYMYTFASTMALDPYVKRTWETFTPLLDPELVQAVEAQLQ